MDLTSEEDLFGNLNSDSEDNVENIQNSANVSSVSQDSLFVRPQKRKKAKLFNNSARTEDPNFSKLLDRTIDLPARKPRSRVLTQQTLECEADVNFSYAFQSSQESSPDVPAKKKQALILNYRSQKSDESVSEGNFSQAFGSSQEFVFRLPARKKKGPVSNHLSKVELESDANFSKAFLTSTPDVRTRKPQALVFDQLLQGSGDANFSKAIAEHDVTPAETKRASVFNQSQDSEIETNFSKVFDSQNSSIASLTRRKQALLFKQSQRTSDNSEIAEVNFSIALSSSQSSTSALEEERKQKALIFDEHHPDESETNINFSGALLSTQEASLNLPERKKQATVFNESRKLDIEETESNFSRMFSLPQVVSSSVEQPQDLEELHKRNETEIEEVAANLSKTLLSSQHSSTCIPLANVPTLPDTKKGVSIVDTHQRSSDEFQAEDAVHGPIECASSAGEIDPSLTQNKNSTTLQRSLRSNTTLENTAMRSSVSQSMAIVEESRRPSTISSDSRSTTIISKSKIGVNFSAEDSVSECENSPKHKAPRKQNSARNADIRSKPVFPQFLLYCNTRFYDYLISKIELEYGIYANREVVKLVKFISEIVEEITHMKEDHNEKVKILKKTLFDYKVVVTHFDFFSFCMNYFPIRFRCKAVPMKQTCDKPPNVYYDPSTLFSPIKSE